MILKRTRYYTGMAITYLKMSIQSTIEYPAYLVGWFLCNPLQFSMGVIMVYVVTSQFQPLAGWGFEQLLFMYGIGIISHGFSIVLFIQTWYLQYSVTEGSLDRMLLRPQSVIFQFIFSDFNFIGFSDLLPGIVIFIYSCIALPFPFTPGNIIGLIVVIAGSTLLRGGLFTLSGSVSFWVHRTGDLWEILHHMFEYSSRYPITIYPRTIQNIFTFLIPLGFLAFYPASEFLGMEHGFVLPGNLIIWTFIAGLSVYLLGLLVFKLGLRRYESAGS